MVWRAVDFIEITSNLLKSRMLAFGHLRSKWRFMTARVVYRAVAIIEIILNLLKSRMLAFGHLRSKRRFVTARESSPNLCVNNL